MNLHDRDNFRRGLKEGISQGFKQKAIEMAKNLFLKNIPIDIIAECTGLSVIQIKDFCTKK